MGAPETNTAPAEKVALEETRQRSSSQGTTPAGTEAAPVELDHMGREKLPMHRRLYRDLLTPGHALQIIIAAVLAIAIGMAVTSTVEEIPEAARQLVGIPGDLWLRALKAVVLPLLMTAMILAVIRLREMAEGGALLAKWTIGYYVITTIIAIIHSIILTDLVWRHLMTEVSGAALDLSEKDAEMVAERKEFSIADVVVQMFQSFVTDNIFKSMAESGFLAILIAAVVIGYLLPIGGSLIRAVEEVEKVVMRIISFLIKIAPIGVFFLILPNLFRLDIAEIGQNLGVLIGSAVCGMFIHLFIMIPLLVFCIIRKNPYPIWFKSAPAWLTAWGSASSAATLPITMRETIKRGVPKTVVKFAVPLGCLINMDGTAIYFPCCVVFLAQTQGIRLDPAQYTIIVLLSTLASIGTTPIPSSSLVLTVMIAQSVGVPITGMYAVIVAIDWFVDRFRTATNVSCDIYAAAVVTKITGIKDAPEDESSSEEVLEENRPVSRPTVDNTHRV